MATRRPVPAAPETPIERDLLDFVDAGPTPYHVVAEAVRRLEAAGFTRLDERDAWRLSGGGLHYVVRGGSSIAAIRVGARPPAEAGFRIAGAHTDSPGLRLKPRPGAASADHLLLGVEVYGSPILATWLDRDLSLAGRVVVQEGTDLRTRLVRVDRPLCRVSTLAIHLNRAVNEEGLKIDRHRHLSPSLGLIEGGADPAAVAMHAVAEAADCEPDAIRGFDLALFDVQKGQVLGRLGEFLATARLDNLASCHAALVALVRARRRSPGDGGTAPDSTAVAVLFDHEEVGSQTAEGAGGAFLRDVLERAAEAFPAPGGLARAVARSVLVSCDMAHALHPNQPDKHDGVHAPRLNGGPVVKTNANRRYATDAETAAFFRTLCRACGVPCQEFVSRADLACGSTIGPIASAALGVRTVDVGNPMLSMHSCREMAGSRDPAHMTSVLERFFAAADPLPW